MALTVTRTMTTLDDAVEIPTGDLTAVGVELSGTWVGSVAIEACVNPGAAAPVWTAVAAPMTANGVVQVNAGGTGKLRARFALATSGTVGVALTATAGLPAVLRVEGAIATGDAFTGRPVIIGGVYNGEAEPLPLYNGDTVRVRLQNQATVLVSNAVQTKPPIAFSVGTSFTRPADTTAYSVGDLVANNTTAGSVVPMGFITTSASLRIRSLMLSKSGLSLTNASFRVHLYGGIPVCTNGDNGAWLTSYSAYVGAVDVVMDRVFDARALGIVLCDIPVLDSGTFHALVEARGAYTPVSSELFSLIIGVE